ncbi:MAG: sterol desaturase family protein [Acidimicrobiia bacterium]
MTGVLLAIGTFLLMEPLTALIHRFVFHGFGMGWHRSHHEPPRRALEANDLFPVVFSSATIALLSIGVWVGGRSILVPLGVGITAYGATYLVVHDLVIHRRVPWLRIPDRVGRQLRTAHNVHHLYSRAPYGFIAPVVPRDLRARAAARGIDQTPRAITERCPG